MRRAVNRAANRAPRPAIIHTTMPRSRIIAAVALTIAVIAGGIVLVAGRDDQPSRVAAARGTPVEAAGDHAHRYVFATNYSMYGANFGPEGSDSCGGPGGLSPSYVDRVDLEKLTIDKVGQVGMVPKYIAVTPDDKYVLVTN